MPAEPWQCPACKTWIRADVTEHRCEPGAGGSAVPAIPTGGGGGGSVTWSMPPGTVITHTSGTSYELSGDGGNHSAPPGDRVTVTGHTPARYVPAADGMTPHQIREYQDSLNAVAGDPEYRGKVIVLPAGSRAA